jgi:hypothetical protein
VKTTANQKERKFANTYGGRTTVNSGASSWDKADIKIGDVRVEHKHTLNDQLIIKKDWLIKLKNSCNINEFPALAIDISGEEWIMVRPQEFGFILQKIEESKTNEC